MKQDSKALEFIYQDTQIHFLLGNDKNVMVNATEMAKAFGKRIENFKRLDETKIFIKELLEHENAKFDSSHMSEQNLKNLVEDDIINTTNKATYMHRKLALKFAVWLDVKFELWIIDTIDNFLFGYYKEHTTNEHQDIEYLTKLCKSVCNIDWETLPIIRNKYIDDEDDFSEDVDTDSLYSADYFSYFKFGDKTKKMYISKKKIEEETSILYRWIFEQGYTQMKKVNWNGHSLYVENHRGKQEFVGNRYDIMEMLPEIRAVYTSDLCDNPNGIKKQKNILMKSFT